MHRRLFLILAMIALGSSLLFSQDASTLTPEQQEQFNSQKLTVTSFSTLLYSTHWTAAKGYDKINEPDFLRTVGLDKEALDSQSHQGTSHFSPGVELEWQWWDLQLFSLLPFRWPSTQVSQMAPQRPT